MLDGVFGGLHGSVVGLTAAGRVVKDDIDFDVNDAQVSIKGGKTT